MSEDEWGGPHPWPTPWGPPSNDDEDADYAKRRRPDRDYWSKSFRTESGRPARFVNKTFDITTERHLVKSDGSEWQIGPTQVSGNRYQVKLLVSGENGHVKDLWLQRTPDGHGGKMKTLLHLTDPTTIKRLGGFFRSLELMPVDGQRVRVDSTLLQDIATDPTSASEIYQQNPELFRRLVVDDEAARDLIALDHRREQVKHFRKLLENGPFFDSEAVRLNGKESVWQNFFEQNPWILGAVTPGQLFTAWNKKKLERTVVGASIAFPGKRVDALLHTSGVVRSLVFAEFKTHRTALLGKEYRPGCFAPSDELAGGVSQVQGTVHLAATTISDRLAEIDHDGTEIPGRFTYLIRPRSFLVIGHLSELKGEAGGDHAAKIRSFELYRRHLDAPEIVTFDELLARAEWAIQMGMAVE